MNITCCYVLVHAHIEIVAAFVVVNYFCVGVKTIRGGEVTSWTCIGKLIISLFYLPIHIGIRDINYRPQLFNPEVFKEK